MDRTRTPTSPTSVTVVIPAYDEVEAVPDVVRNALRVLRSASFSAHVVVVDDGSTDATSAAVVAIGDADVEVVRLRRNSGKSATLAEGLRHVDGDIVVLLDADGQDDVEAIPRLVKLLDENEVDLITGRRANRQDRFVKKQTSRLYNWATRRLTGVQGRDFNSGFKVMRADVARELDLYGELHRYIPVLAHWRGFRVAEVDVAHFPRAAGRPKFGGARFWRGFIDLLTVKFLTTYTNRPLHLFGGSGVIVGGIGFLILAALSVEKILFGAGLSDRPLLVLGVLLVIVGVQLFLFGLLAELIVHLNRVRGPDRSPVVDTTSS